MASDGTGMHGKEKVYYPMIVFRQSTTAAWTSDKNLRHRQMERGRD